ncbi:MAG: hypothetical protein Q9174_003335 [Haloplaca sp. 1 TL-2023]
MRRYKYERLKPDTRTTRLVTVFPGSFNEDLHLSLRTANVDETRYEALSYTWGSTENMASVYFGDRQSPSSEVSEYLEVTQNLEVTLRYLRLEENSRDIWIDAICIDQQNTEERGQQVGMMGAIYQKASGVVIWLGESSNDSKMALTLLRYLSSRVKIDWQRQKVISMTDGETDLTRHKIELPFGEEQWRSILAFLQRPWFHRLWIWQEVLLAKTATIYCGYDTCKWNDFRKAILALQSKEPPKNMSKDWQTPYDDVLHHIYHLTCRRPFKGDFLSWTERTERCKYSDPRDRIYALLHVIDRAESTVGMKPDYKETPVNIYREVILRDLDRSRELNMLKSCELGNESLGLKPSWVPDWSTPQASDHTVDGRATFGAKARARHLGDGRLAVSGILAAEIDSVEDHFLQEPLHHARVERSKVINLFAELRDQIERSPSELDEDQLAAAFCRTLCMNMFADSYVPAVSGYPYLEQSLEFLSSLLFAQPGHIKPPPHAYLDQVAMHSRGRCLFTTKDGSIGLGPKKATVGDRVSSVLGCNSPLVLRPDDGGNFTVVGECYLHGMMTNEALLGPLPSEWKPVAILVKAGYEFGFANAAGFDKVFEDPRLGPLPAGWKIRNPEKRAGPENWVLGTDAGKELPWPEDPRMTVEALEARGIALQELLLI